MSPQNVQPAHRGFTLIEIMIVVVILGILASLVLPQFANASDDARRVNMRNQLQTIRGTVQLYRIEHYDVAPLLITDGWDVVTNKTLADGTLDEAGTWGPYLPSPPVNPLTKSSTIVPLGTAPSPDNGWFYDEADGAFHGANQAGEMSDTGE